MASTHTCVHNRVRDWVVRHTQLVTVVLSGLLIAVAWILRAMGVSPVETHGAVHPGTTGTGLLAWPALSSPFAVLMTAAAIVAGINVAKEAVGRLLAKQFSIPLLVTIAAIGALWIGEVWEAAAVTFLYVFGGYLEGLTLARTRAALRTLIDLSPRTARVKRGDGRYGDGHPNGDQEGRANGRQDLIVVPATDVQPGEIVVVLPGDRVPVDGVVIEGRSSLDTSPLTGEPLPVEVGPGDSVLGGSVSQGGFLEIRAEKVGPDTTFSRMLFLVAEAQEQRPKVQRALDRFALWYTPLIISLAGVLFAITRDVHLALTFLVIGCPGALVVASPVAVVAGLGNAARKGILIKGGERLERIGKVDVMAFDKTGTLTLGRPRVTWVEAFGPADTGSSDSDGNSGSSQVENFHRSTDEADKRRVVSLAAAAEVRSEHHLARAILEYAKDNGIEAAEATGWSLLPGLGATAETENGTVLVGNRRLLASRNANLTAEHEAAAASYESQGATVAFVALGDAPVGLIAITDPPRPGADTLVTALKQAGVKHTVMLTGDNAAAAGRVASNLGIDEVRAGLLPEEKVQAIRELQAAGHVVAMVGDGINDAPALATADVSIAMGVSGTEAAIEAADIALMTDRLERVPQAIGLSRRILQVVRQNVVFAVAVVAVLLAGVIGRLVFLSGGMLIHEASVLLVILNGMRLLKK